MDLAALSRVLVVNAGSTSLKLSIVEGETSTAVDDFVPAGAVGHRIVHFGGLAVEAVLLDDWVMPYIEQGAEIAPLHNRPALEAIERARTALPDVPHVAVSDSYFHRTMPRTALVYAVPERWRREYDVVRHGFHGLAVADVAARVPVARLVVCHLGGGCSVTAVLDGRSVDTTMGFTPVEGVPMVTRSGSVDPGALVYLARSGVGLDELDHGLNEESGLAALGGLDDEFGREYFAYHVAKAIGAMATVLAGVDAVAFSGGIGENRADVREAIVERLGFLGDVRVEVVAPREDLVIVQAVRRTLAR